MPSCLKCAITAAMVFGWAMISPAHAGDWSLKESFEQKLLLDDNLGNLADSKGWVFSPMSTLTSELMYAMPEGNFVLTNDLLFQQFFGPGSDSLKTIYPAPNIEALLTKNGPRSHLTLNAKYSSRQIRETDPFEFIDCIPIPGTNLVDCPDDRGVVEPLPIFQRSNSSKLSAKISYGYDIGPRDSVTLANAYNMTNYNGLGDDYWNNNITVVYQRRLTKRLDGTLGFGINWLSVANNRNLDRYTYNANAKLVKRINGRLSVHAGTSLFLANSIQDGLPPITSRTSDLRFNGSGNVGFDLLMDPATTLTFDATVFTQQFQDSDYLQRLSTTAALTHNINERSFARISGNFSLNEFAQAGGGTDVAMFVSVQPSYSIDLAKDWNMLASYKFVYIDTGNDSIISNEVAITLTHDFYLFH